MSGKNNAVADFLSRNPVESPAETDCEPEVGLGMPIRSCWVEDNIQHADIAMKQRADTMLLHLINFLEKGELSGDDRIDKITVWEAEKYVMLDNVLYYLDRQNRRIKLLVIPESMKQKIIKSCHSDITGVHFAATKTYQKIKDRFFWKGMYRDVHQTCDNCEECARFKGCNKPIKPPLQPLPTVEQPFDRIAMDCIGPLPQSEEGYRFIVVFVDSLTRWPIAVPTYNITAETIARVLIDHVVSQHGCPRSILSDLGTNFMSDLMKSVYNICNIEHVTCLPYRQQTNGQVEKCNQTIKTALSLYVGQNQSKWAQALSCIMFVIRSSVNETTKFTPFSMVYGREPLLPCETVFTFVKSPYIIDINDYVTELKDNLSKAWKTAGQYWEVSRKRMIEKRSCGDRKLVRKGDTVYVKRYQLSNAAAGVTRKLLAKFAGPFVILDVVMPNVLVDLGEGSKKWYHLEQCKVRQQSLDTRGTDKVEPPQIESPKSQ